MSTILLKRYQYSYELETNYYQLIYFRIVSNHEHMWLRFFHFDNCFVLISTSGEKDLCTHLLVRCFQVMAN